MANNGDTAIQPVGDRVLVKEVEEEAEEETTEAGIIIPEAAQDNDANTTRGEVKAVGEGERKDGERVPVPVDVGDTVLFSWGDKLTVDGEDYHIVDSGNILAIVN